VTQHVHVTTDEHIATILARGAIWWPAALTRSEA